MKSKLFLLNDKIVHSAYSIQDESLNKTEISHRVGNAAFKNDSIIEYVYLNSNVEFLSESAFENCSELKIVEYRDDNEIDKDKKEESSEEQNLEKTESDSSFVIQYHAFKDCYNLHTVIFPDLHEDKKIIIEKEAFLGCKSLRTVVIWNGNAAIDNDAFRGCDNEKLVFVINNNDSNCSVARFARENGFRCICANKSI